MLLDTNSLLWVLTDDDRLGPSTRSALTAASAVYSSPISIVEVRIKSMLGKLDVQEGLIEAIRAAGIEELAFLDTHADALLAFPDLYRHDPFDRMLLAHASASGIPLVTSDSVLLRVAPTHTRDATL